MSYLISRSYGVGSDVDWGRSTPMDLSHREVAERMGISEKTVENHLTRALARITEALVADTRAVEADIAEPSVRRTDADRGID